MLIDVVEKQTCLLNLQGEILLFLISKTDKLESSRCFYKKKNDFVIQHGCHRCRYTDYREICK